MQEEFTKCGFRDQPASGFRDANKGGFRPAPGPGHGHLLNAVSERDVRHPPLRYTFFFKFLRILYHILLCTSKEQYLLCYSLAL
jgi:hypothetical protein